MEMFEIRYFASVSSTQSISLSARRLNVSASAVSKAISRLESELGTKLIEKTGRNIRLTDKGEVLATQVGKLLRLHQETKVMLSAEKTDMLVRFSGPEILLSSIGIDLVNQIRKRHPKAEFEFSETTEKQALESLLNQSTDLALVTHAPRIEKLRFKLVSEENFGTFVSPQHPLAKRKEIPIQEVLENDFVTPNESVFESRTAVSTDGWRDDRFRRKVRYVGASVRVLEALVTKGLAIGYLPIDLGKRMGLNKLKITGCHYTCQQKIYLATHVDAPVIALGT